MCGLQEDTIFSVLSPPLRGHVWDHIGLVESPCVYQLGDTLDPHPPSHTAGVTSLWKLLIAGLLAMSTGSRSLFEVNEGPAVT